MTLLSTWNRTNYCLTGPRVGGGVTSDQLFVILVEIFVVPLNKWENALCSVWFCHFTPWTWLLKFAHYSALQCVVQGSLWIFWFNKEPFWLFKFPWTISEGSIKNSFFKPFEKFQKTRPKKVLYWTKNGSKSHFWNHFWFRILFFGTFFCSLRVLLRGQL